MRKLTNSFVLAACFLALAVANSVPARSAPANAESGNDVDGTAQAPVAEAAKVTTHDVEIGGRTIRYRATAGTLTIRDDEGKPTASMFYIAYVAEGRQPRPLTFLFNGGPGSASLWLNVGGFGPMRVPTSATQATGPAPYRFIRNTESLLDKSDLVFLDAIGTGYSRAIGDAKAKDFWGVDSDVDAFARAIKRYVTLNRRWNSPKFLFGESYGTTRAAALVLALENQDMDFNGVILQSTILNFADMSPGLDQEYIDTLPSFAAAAWYHDKITDKPANLQDFLQQVRDYARGPYAEALARGDTLSSEQADAVAQRLAVYTGLPVDYLKRANLRIDMEEFRKQLLKDQHLVIGRFDSRFTGPESNATEHSDPARDDPATAGVSSAHLSAFRDYLSGELGYRTDLDYRALYNMVIEPAWDMHHRAPGIPSPLTTPNVALDLAAAMRANPHLQVLSLNGLYDMSTPFFATEYDLSHMFLSAEQKRNLRITYYASGHMTYIDVDALKQMKRDLSQFYDKAAPAHP